MSAELRCIRCGFRTTGEAHVMAEAYLNHDCATADDLTVTDEQWEAFETRHAHPSFGGDAA